MLRRYLSGAVLPGVLALSIAGIGCSDNREVGTRERKADTPVERKAERAADATERKAEELGNKAENAADRTGDKMRRAGDKTEGAMDNAGMTASVKSKLAADVRLSTLTSIDVDSNSGVVTLNGNVPTAADRTKAERVARSVDGVAKVVNNLKVK